jgi:hypothetical protein
LNARKARALRKAAGVDSRSRVYYAYGQPGASGARVEADEKRQAYQKRKRR